MKDATKVARIFKDDKAEKDMECHFWSSTRVDRSVQSWWKLWEKRRSWKREAAKASDSTQGKNSGSADTSHVARCPRLVDSSR